MGVIIAAVALLGVAGGALWWSSQESGTDNQPETTIPIGPVVAEVTGFELADAGIDVIVGVADVPAGAVARLVATDTGAVLTEQAGPGPVELRWPSAPSGPTTVSVEIARGDDTESLALGFEIPPAVVGAESFNQWIMLLASLPTVERAERFTASLGAGLGEVRILSSDEWPSLNPGFFVPYVGPFASGDDVIARCQELGLSTPDDCAGRFLSTDQADRRLLAG